MATSDDTLRERLSEHRWLNLLQTILLIGALVLLMGLSARLIFGEGAFVWTTGGVALGLLLAPRLSPTWILRLYRAAPISARQAPELHGVVAELSRRAGLARPPTLFLVPSRMMNAFAVGSRGEAYIALTDGLLRNMGRRPLTAILAHEISHVRHNDMQVMGLADLVSRMTSILSTTGQILIILNLPLMLFGHAVISWWGLLLLVFAPTLSALLQLALSRTREYDADLGAVRLTGDPEGLAMALDRLERYQGGLMEQLLWPNRRNPHPSVLRTHPATGERIARLRALAGDGEPLRHDGGITLATPEPANRRPRRHYLSGLWY